MSYDGSIKKIGASDISKFRDLSAENGNVFAAQNVRLADNGIYPAITMAGKEGSLIVAGNVNPEKVLDVLFNVPALERSAKVIPFAKVEQEQREPTILRTAFENAAPRFRLGANFAQAARAVFTADNNDFAPALQAA